MSEMPADVDYLASKYMAAWMVGEILSVEEVVKSAIMEDRQRREARHKKLALTPKQKELLSFIRLYCTDQGGVSPSYDEMKDFVGLNSKSGIHRMITALEERGHIRRLPGHARSIVVADCEATL